jgi:hypothetical protein
MHNNAWGDGPATVGEHIDIVEGVESKTMAIDMKTKFDFADANVETNEQRNIWDKSESDNDEDVSNVPVVTKQELHDFKKKGPRLV